MPFRWKINSSMPSSTSSRTWSLSLVCVASLLTSGFGGAPHSLDFTVAASTDLGALVAFGPFDGDSGLGFTAAASPALDPSADGPLPVSPISLRILETRVPLMVPALPAAFHASLIDLSLALESRWRQSRTKVVLPSPCPAVVAMIVLPSRMVLVGSSLLHPTGQGLQFNCRRPLRGWVDPRTGALGGGARSIGRVGRWLQSARFSGTID